MKTCPFCAERIQDEAIKCRYCGEFLDGRTVSAASASSGYIVPAYWAYEYRSSIELFGMPLVHIAYGVNPTTGLPRVARGFIAIGNFAIGVFAVGGIALGLFVLSGIGLGLVTIAGIAMGVIVAFGGISMSLGLAVGGVALSLYYAIGGLPLAPYTLSATGAGRQVVEMILNCWSGVQSLSLDL